MKQYTNESQTAKLVELGFVPKMRIKSVGTKYGMGNIENEPYFDVGKLIEMLPENVAKENEIPSTLNISLMNGEWCVQYADLLGADFEFCNTELVDALYDMVVKLKAEGVI
jgi:hypothetical protein